MQRRLQGPKQAFGILFFFPRHAAIIISPVFLPLPHCMMVGVDLQKKTAPDLIPAGHTSETLVLFPRYTASFSFLMIAISPDGTESRSEEGNKSRIGLS